MKKILAYILLLAFGMSLCACDVDMSGIVSNVLPTEEHTKAIQIIAPLDIYAAVPQAAGNVNLTVQEGYKLIHDLNSDDYPYSRYYDPYSSSWWRIDIVPMLLESDMQDRTMSYAARTNFSGFFERNTKYLGMYATNDKFFSWRGEYNLPQSVMQIERPEHIWVDILIKADGKVVGFAVLEIVDWIWNGTYRKNAYAIEDRYTEYYPLIDGQFQEVTEEFAWQRIEQYHRYAESAN